MDNQSADGTMLSDTKDKQEDENDNSDVKESKWTDAEHLCLEASSVAHGMDDVKGMEDVKKDLKEILVLPYKFPKLFEGFRLPHRGILIYGAPGVGKTMLVKSLAKEIPEATFINAHAIDFVSKYVHGTESMIRDIFRMAIAKAPSIIFLDEYEMLLSEENNAASHNTKRSAVEMVCQMDDLMSQNKNVVVVAATNAPWKIAHFARKRLSKRIHIPMPDAEARSQIFETKLKSAKHTLNEDDFRELGQRTDGYTGSDVICVACDACMEPVRKIQAAKYYTKVKGPSPKDPNVVVDDLFTPCSPDTAGATEMDWTKIDPDKLLLPVITMEDMLKAIRKPTVTKEDQKRLEEFKDTFGPEK